ncbi:MAG: DUF2294 domain-containing protein [Pleurocapsa sp.]
MKKTTINIKRIKNILSQNIRDIYKNQLKQQLDNISFHLFDGTLIVIIEGTVTCPEKLLKANDRLVLGKQVREAIDRIIQPQIVAAIEQVMNVRVVDFLSDTTIENNCTGAIAILEFKSHSPVPLRQTDNGEDEEGKQPRSTGPQLAADRWSKEGLKNELV